MRYTEEQAPSLNNRYNLYTNIHKGLRAFMADTLIKVGRTDGQDADQVEETSTALRSLLMFCRGHLAHEDEFIHPAMDVFQPGASAACAQDHLDHISAINQLELHLEQAQLLSSLGTADATSVWLGLYLHLNQFVADNYLHMQEEEQQNMAVLWHHYSDEQLLGISKTLVASIGPDEMALSLRWMLPNLNHAERCALLGGLQAQMPAQVFAERLKAVEAVISPRDWTKLMAALRLAELEAA